MVTFLLQANGGEGLELKMSPLEYRSLPLTAALGGKNYTVVSKLPRSHSCWLIDQDLLNILSPLPLCLFLVPQRNTRTSL